MRNHPTAAGRHHLHGLPRDHARQQHAGQRRLHDRRAAALSVRLQRRIRSCSGSTTSWSRRSRSFTRRRSSRTSTSRPSSARPATRCSLPLALNHYKEFLRGQNHYDPFLLSGVSGHGARSFYYPPKAEANCNALPHAAQAVGRLRGEVLRGCEGTERPQSPVPRGQHGHRLAARSAGHRRGASGVSEGRRARRYVRRARRGRDRRQADRPAAADSSGAEARQEVPARNGDSHAEAGAPVHAGHGRLERSLARRDRELAAIA